MTISLSNDPQVRPGLEKRNPKIFLEIIKSQRVALTVKKMKGHGSEGWDVCINLRVANRSHKTNCKLKLIYNSNKC